MIKYTLLFLLIAASVSGCINNRITRYYDFTAPEHAIDHKDMVIGVNLVGTSIPGGKRGRYDITIQSSPYKLYLYIRSLSHYYQSARITNIRMRKAGKELVDIPLDDASLFSKFEETSLNYTAVFSINKLELSHEPHKLTVSMEIKTRSNSLITRRFEFQLTPRYIEKKSNDTWSRH